MKLGTLAILLMVTAAVASGCAGGDAQYSPDPSVGDSPVSQPSPQPGQDGGASDEKGGVVTTDCFESGFCYRACAAAQDCPAGFSCVMKVCTFDCQSDEECGAGGKCGKQKLCEEAGGDAIPPCTGNADCGEGRLCNADGACEKIAVSLGCRADLDCPAGQYCDAARQCQLYPASGVSCSADLDCLGNYYCNAASQCQQDCRTDFQCADGQSCDAHGRCVVPGAPAKFATFSFNALGADADPSGQVVFKSQSFVIDSAEIVPAGRDETLTSSRFRLIGSAGF